MLGFFNGYLLRNVVWGDAIKACYRGIKAFIDRYNDRRRHSSLDNHTPRRYILTMWS
ncbi:integrase core domain-containing protein [Fibrobacter sp.]|uniref:integrase core domain-containing protein n=1 Tax=Fibrobacter sp. TaxID=35828 RepID=UPI00345D70E9